MTEPIKPSSVYSNALPDYIIAAVNECIREKCDSNGSPRFNISFTEMELFERIKNRAPENVLRKMKKTMKESRESGHNPIDIIGIETIEAIEYVYSINGWKVGHDTIFHGRKNSDEVIGERYFCFEPKK